MKALLSKIFGWRWVLITSPEGGSLIERARLTDSGWIAPCRVMRKDAWGERYYLTQYCLLNINGTTSENGTWKPHTGWAGKATSFVGGVDGK